MGKTLHFSYEGFTQAGNKRSFAFRGVDEHTPGALFSIQVELALFIQHRVSLQEGPSFCLQLLTNACALGAVSLGRLENYTVIGEDFRPLTVERQRREAEKALKKQARSPYRKPSFSSNLRMVKREEVQAVPALS